MLDILDIKKKSLTRLYTAVILFNHLPNKSFNRFQVWTLSRPQAIPVIERNKLPDTNWSKALK